tara:strand:- start:1494 stop:1628 length:135 start_codon:yes stop_codon:yes gene_type:complete
MTPREEAEIEAKKTYTSFLLYSKRVSIIICFILFVVVVIFDSGV